MRDLICDVINYCVWSCDNVKISLGLYDKIAIAKPEKDKRIEKREFLSEFPSKFV